jgi:hypothetical protein
MRRAATWVFLFGVLFAGGLAAAPEAEEESGDWSWKPIVEARLRGEAFVTPAPTDDPERDYELFVGRVRVGGEAAWRKQVVLRGLVQAAFAEGVPDNAAFGAGQNIFNTNQGDTSPEQIGIAELALLWKAESFTLAVGRQGWADGGGPETKVANLDFVRSRRMAERLLGNLEFANIARRFDGVTFAGKPGAAGVFEAFALRPLAGALNYDQAFEQLDIDTFGASWATPYDDWIPKSTLRLFAQSYRDEREVALSSLGDEISIETYGGSFLAGGPSWDLLAWGAVQRGDYGARTHSAWAAVAEAGYRFTGVHGEPSVHLVWEKASGGESASENENFWNGLPTNHRYYDLLDYFAFSNLQDFFVETRWSPAKGVSLSLMLHDFRLSDRSGPWVSGSGPFSDRELGFASRRPASGHFASSDLGRELDLATSWTFATRFTLKVEAGRFVGGDAAEEAFPAAANGSWAGVELNWSY